jgi:hypothetical protein
MKTKARAALASIALALALACHSSTTAPSAPVQVGLTVNGAAMGSVSCGRAITLAVAATNLSTEPVTLESLSIRFRPHSGSCREHDAPISPILSGILAAGGTAEVRRFDAAGTLCLEPYGGSACAWTATAELTTSAGRATDSLGLATFLGAAAGCEDLPAPRILLPADGATVSGTVDVSATLVESPSCVLSARTVVEAFSAQGEPAFTSFNLDLGDHYPWNTKALPNGQYWLTAYQNCCRVRSAAVVVTVQN